MVHGAMVQIEKVAKAGKREKMSDSDLLFALMEWIGSDAPEGFNPDFIQSVRGYYQVHDRITGRQRIALDNIVEKFDINVESYL